MTLVNQIQAFVRKGLARNALAAASGIRALDP